jgi:hypothetical protein
MLCLRDSDTRHTIYFLDNYCGKFYFSLVRIFSTMSQEFRVLKIQEQVFTFLLFTTLIIIKIAI